MSKKVVQRLLEYSHPSWAFKSFRVVKRGKSFYPETMSDSRNLFLAFLELRKALGTVVFVSAVALVITFAMAALGVFR